MLSLAVQGALQDGILNGIYLFVLHVSEAYRSSDQALDLYSFVVVLVWRVVDFHMLVSLLKACAAIL